MSTRDIPRPGRERMSSRAREDTQKTSYVMKRVPSSHSQRSVLGSAIYLSLQLAACRPLLSVSRRPLCESPTRGQQERRLSIPSPGVHI